MEYTTVAQVEGAIALQQDLRWHAKDPEVRVAASARIAELRALRLKLKEQAQRESIPEGAVPVGVDLCCECKRPLRSNEYGLCRPCDEDMY